MILYLILDFRWFLLIHIYQLKLLFWSSGSKRARSNSSPCNPRLPQSPTPFWIVTKSFLPHYAYDLYRWLKFHPWLKFLPLDLKFFLLENHCFKAFICHYYPVSHNEIRYSLLVHVWPCNSTLPPNIFTYKNSFALYTLTCLTPLFTLYIFLSLCVQHWFYSIFTIYIEYFQNETFTT